MRQQARVARHVDDRAAAAFLHQGNNPSREEERRFEIRIEAGVPHRFGDVGDLLDHADAGVVDQNIDAAGRRRGHLDQPLHVALSRTSQADRRCQPGETLIVFLQQAKVADEDLTWRCAKRTAVALPMPLAPPVTIATCPLKSTGGRWLRRSSTNLLGGSSSKSGADSLPESRGWRSSKYAFLPGPFAFSIWATGPWGKAQCPRPTSLWGFA